ncbi:MAG TPA: hypothetical protein VKK79_00225 [Candidatus Lokiarchaeia archaeon]|nr:hypothetical protein [Candidatus Lokiarchaeia archaeon]
MEIAQTDASGKLCLPEDLCHVIGEQCFLSDWIVAPLGWYDDKPEEASMVRHLLLELVGDDLAVFYCNNLE